jgi:hypothetical protein
MTEGKIAIVSADIAAKFNLQAGVDLFSQATKLSQISIRLEATIGSRAVGQLARLGGGSAIGGAVRVLSGPVGIVLTEFLLHMGNAN